jgi:hypothetical protein
MFDLFAMLETLHPWLASILDQPMQLARLAAQS